MKTLEELNLLSPMALKPYNPQYEDWFELERNTLYELFKHEAIYIEHIGSTAIKQIKSKPIVDILLIVDPNLDRLIIIDRLSKLDYTLMHDRTRPFQISFNKGYTVNGYKDKVFHLHVRYEGLDEVYFRDALNRNINIAKTYETLKEELFKKYSTNLYAYQLEKTFFVSLITELEKSKKH